MVVPREQARDEVEVHLRQGPERLRHRDPGGALKLLVLGGTRFLGRHLVTEALARGHEVALFNRGRSNPELFPDVERLRGERDPDVEPGLDALRGRTWDAVIDTCGYVPRIVSASAETLEDAVGTYLFVSSISVYADFSERGLTEEARTVQLADETDEEVGGGTYGGLKALCEDAVTDVFDERALNVRPGLIVGPHDTTGRFTWWVERIARGGDVLAPGDPEQPVQFIDARDLARWMLAALERGETGTLQVTGPTSPLTLGELLERLRSALNPDARLVPVPDAFLLEQGVEPFAGLPLWVPGTEHSGFLDVDIGRALATGLETRPVEETARDTLAWVRDGEPPVVDELLAGRPSVGLDPAREAELLAAWSA